MQEWTDWANLLLKYWVIVAGTTAVIAGIAATIKWYLQRRDERNQRQFEHYHRLIDEFVGKAEKRDRQIAIAYELHHFPRYYPVTHRILTHLLKEWESDSKNQGKNLDPLYREMRMTLAYIDKKDPKLKNAT
jgi:hypothetical protein